MACVVSPQLWLCLAWAPSSLTLSYSHSQTRCQLWIFIFSKSLRSLSLFNICLLCWDLPGLVHKAWFTQSLKQLSVTDGKVLSVAFSPDGCGNFPRTSQKPTSCFSHLRDESDSILLHQCFLTVVRAWGRTEVAPKIYLKGWVWFFNIPVLEFSQPGKNNSKKIHKSQQLQ